MRSILSFEINPLLLLKVYIHKKKYCIFLLLLLLCILAGVILRESHICIFLFSLVIDYLYTNIINLAVSSLTFSIILGANFFRYDDYKELLLLFGLPISHKKIAEAKICILLIDIVLLFVALFLLIMIINIEAYYLLGALTLMLSIIAFLLMGMCLSFFLTTYCGKVTPYFLVAFFLLLAVVNPVKVVEINYFDTIIASIISLLIIFILYQTSIFLLEQNMLNVVSINESVSLVLVNKHFSSHNDKVQNITLTVMQKEFLHYKREVNSLFQMLIFDALIFISIVCMGDKSESLAVQVLINSIPFALVGQVALYSFGSDGSLLELIYIACGSLKKYYLTRLIVAITFVSVPVICVNFLLYFIYPDLFTFVYVRNIFMLTILKTTFAVGISVCFISKSGGIISSNNVTKIRGMMLYYILGMGIPIFIAFNSVKTVPVFFVVYALVELIFSLYFGIQGYRKVNNVVNG